MKKLWSVILIIIIIICFAGCSNNSDIKQAENVQFRFMDCSDLMKSSKLETNNLNKIHIYVPIITNKSIEKISLYASGVKIYPTSKYDKNAKVTVKANYKQLKLNKKVNENNYLSYFDLIINLNDKSKINSIKKIELLELKLLVQNGNEKITIPYTDTYYEINIKN